MLDRRYRPEEIARVNAGLRQRLRLHADAVQSSTHLLHLPGSLNLKDATAPKPCTIVAQDTERRYGLNELPQGDGSVRKTTRLLGAAHRSPQRKLMLALLVDLLPPKARRTLACGEWYDDKEQQTTQTPTARPISTNVSSSSSLTAGPTRRFGTCS